MVTTTTRVLPGISDETDEFADVLKSLLSDAHQDREVVHLLFQDQGNVDLFNRHVPAFGNYLQHLVIDRMILGAARLLDRDIQSGRENVSFANLARLVRLDGETSLADELDSLIAAAASQHRPVILRRHRSVGHNDRQTRQDREPPIRVSPRDLDVLYDDVEKILHHYDAAVHDSYANYTNVSGNNVPAVQLLNALRGLN